MEKNRSDKRKFLRFDVETKVNFVIQEKGYGVAKKFSGINKNLCLEGVCFISERKVDPGAILKLEIFLPRQSQPLHLEGEVRWSQAVTKTGEKDMWETGVRLFTLEKTDDSKFVGYVYDKEKKMTKKYRKVREGIQTRISIGPPAKTFGGDSFGAGSRNFVVLHECFDWRFMKKCPFCAEEIQEEAVKCRHCGEFLNKDQAQKYPWYFRTSTLVTGFLCAGPLILPLVWFHPRLGKGTKIVVTIIILGISWALTQAVLGALNHLKQYYQFMP